MVPPPAPRVVARVPDLVPAEIRHGCALPKGDRDCHEHFVEAERATERAVRRGAQCGFRAP
eukprot:10921265-Lingulodinium_polyedra.AAC.1